MKALNVLVGTETPIQVQVREGKIASLYDLIEQRREAAEVPLNWYEPVQRQTDNVRRVEWQQHYLAIVPTGDPHKDPWTLRWIGNGIQAWQREVWDEPGPFSDVLEEFIDLLKWAAAWQEPGLEPESELETVIVPPMAFFTGLLKAGVR